MEALAVVEVLGRHGEILHRERLFSLPAIIGRGFDADLMLDDPHVAAHHLRLEASDKGGFVLTDLETHNGFSVPAHPIGPLLATTEISAGETIRLGHSQIRIWRPDSTVSPEVPTRNAWNPRGWLSSAAWIVTALILIGAFAWIEATGANRDGAVSMCIMVTGILMAVWSGLWWVASRSSHRPDAYLAHLAVAGRMVCLVILGQIATSTMFFVFDLHRYGLDQVSNIVLGGCLAYGGYRHLRLVSRKPRRVLGTMSIALVAALLVPANYISNQYDLDKRGLLDIPSTLRPPWMRVSEGVSPEEFLK
ncbi:FHA domain-containing protein [Propionivibrio sp.]|uniref:FHA domain-containing protein n=1 Tax=Propionivibrio sp. TaxID=2212460 RepID=UPI003BF43A08